MMEKKLEKNLKYATETVRKNPFDIEANYNYAVCSEEAGYYDDAYDYYLRVVFLQEQYKKNLISLQKLSQRVEALQKLAETDEELKVQMQDKDDARLYATHDPFKDYNFPIIGKMLIDSSHCC
jgi:tetratricopeptide (TPR) repeat protein